MKKYFSFLFISFLLVLSTETRASHMIGGEITYRYVGGTMYEITLALYRDCQGIGAPGQVQVYFNSVSNGLSLSTSLNQVPGTGIEVTPHCSSALTTCNGGFNLGVQKWTYQGNYTFPVQANDWVISYKVSYRSGSITNLANPGQDLFYIETTLNNLSFPFNNSAQFANDPVITLNIGNSYTINNGIYDPDGDSLVIVLTPALTDTNTPAIYSPGFTFLNPITSAPPIVVDSSSGDLTIAPQAVEVDVIALLIYEYRNGQLVGTAMRDMTVYVEAANANTLPSINYLYPFVATACYGDTLNLNIISTDADVADSTFIDTVLFDIPAGSNQYFVTNGQNQSAQFQFVPDSTMISSDPYLLKIRVRDNACPYNGIQSYTFRIFVNNCDSVVWPGDADADLDADVYDILPIGIGYGATGPLRAGASVNWIGQPATSWSQSLLSGINYMHADCNGDGIIDMSDTLAISINYGQTHPLRRVQPQEQTVSTGSIYLDASADTVVPGSVVQIAVQLGTSADPVDSIYGVALRLNFNPQIVDAAGSYLQFTNSWLGDPGIDLITLKKEFFTAGFVDLGAVRTNQTDKSGYGSIAILTLKINNNASWGTNAFSCSNIIGINSMEVIRPLSGYPDSILVNPYVGISTQPDDEIISAFPNPVRSDFFINATSKIQSITIYNGTGTMCHKVVGISAYTTVLNISDLSDGVYQCRIITEKGIQNKMIVKLN